MAKLKNLNDLRKISNEYKSKSQYSKNRGSSGNHVQVKVAMATCSIASGSREVMNYIADELEKRNIETVVSRTGCMGYCYAEPTIEITLPGKEPIVFGYVNMKKADEIIEKYIKGGALVEGIIPVNYEPIDNK